MSTLVEIESVVKQLPPAERQQLLIFLAQSLRSESRPLPELRQFSAAELQAWVQEDERDFQELQNRP